MGEKNIWERIKDSSNCRVLILNLILTLCLNLLLEFTERRSVSEVFFLHIILYKVLRILKFFLGILK